MKIDGRELGKKWIETMGEGIKSIPLISIFDAGFNASNKDVVLHYKAELQRLDVECEKLASYCKSYDEDLNKEKFRTMYQAKRYFAASSENEKLKRTLKKMIKEKTTAPRAFSGWKPSTKEAIDTLKRLLKEEAS